MSGGGALFRRIAWLWPALFALALPGPAQAEERLILASLAPAQPRLSLEHFAASPSSDLPTTALLAPLGIALGLKPLALAKPTRAEPVWGGRGSRLLGLPIPLQGETRHPARPPQMAASRHSVCAFIERESTARGLPPIFMARLIWKESRFNALAVSPKGARGIAQFMPATAAERGLVDPYDVDEAIMHSAMYVSDLSAQFGNLGLAAAAYNAGPGRVAGWIAGRRTLPAETRDYVASITGAAAEEWRDGRADLAVTGDLTGQRFRAGCAKMEKAALARPAKPKYARTKGSRPQGSRPREKRTVRVAARFLPLRACEAGRLCKVGR